MVTNNESRYRTAFTVSIEAREGVTTGVSAADRVTTILTAIAENAQPEDLSAPDTFFLCAPPPVVCWSGAATPKVRWRWRGWPDCSLAAVLCELTNPDGTMAKGDEITRFAARHDMVILSIAELADYITEAGR